MLQQRWENASCFFIHRPPADDREGDYHDNGTHANSGRNLTNCFGVFSAFGCSACLGACYVTLYRPEAAHWDAVRMPGQLPQGVITWQRCLMLGKRLLWWPNNKPEL